MAQMTVSALVVNPDDQICLVKTAESGERQLPGRLLVEGEKFERAIHCILQMQLGVEGTIDGTPFATLKNAGSSHSQAISTTTYRVRIGVCAITPTLGIIEHSWFDPSSICSGATEVSEITRKAVEAFLLPKL